MRPRSMFVPLLFAIAPAGCLQDFEPEVFEIGECNLLNDKGCTQQTNCAGFEDPACIAQGTTEAGRPCSDDTECARGHLCAEHEGDRRCWAKCDTGSGTCAAGGTCVAMTGTASEIYELGLCLPECKPSTGGGCTAGKQCLVAWTPNCATAGNATVGSPCDNDANRCVPDAVCVGEGEDARCRTRCAGGGPADACPDNGYCAGLEIEPGVGLYGDPGVCLPVVDCDLVTNEGCSDGHACETGASGGRVCYVAGTFGVGFACGSSSDCTADAFCVSGQCVQRCDVAEEKGEPCPDGKTCVELTDPNTGAPLETYPGACAP